MDVSTNAAGLLFAAVALGAWSGLSFCIRNAMRDAPLFKTTAMASTLNGLLVTAIAFASLPVSAFIPSHRSTIYLLILLGIGMIALSRLTYYFAIRRIGPSRTIPVASSTPAVIAFLAAFYLDEPVTLRMLVGLALLIGGVIIVVRSDPGHAGTGDPQSGRDRMLGWISAGCTTLLWAVTGIMLKVAAQDVHSLAAAAMVMWVGAPVTWGIAWIAGLKTPQVSFPRKNWRWLIAAVICQTAAIPAYSAALVRTLAVNVTSITALQPMVVIFIAHLFLREAENVTPRLVGGACLTMVGTLVVLM